MYGEGRRVKHSCVENRRLQQFVLSQRKHWEKESEEQRETRLKVMQITQKQPIRV